MLRSDPFVKDEDHFRKVEYYFAGEGPIEKAEARVLLKKRVKREFCDRFESALLLENFCRKRFLCDGESFCTNLGRAHKSLSGCASLCA